MSEQDHLERLRGVARLGDLPAGLRLLLGSLTEVEMERLEALAASWPGESGPPPRGVVRRCLDGGIG